MKKALLPAIISALFATSASAANLYDAEGTSVNLSGEVDAFYKTSTSEGFTEKDDNGNDVEVADEDGVVSTWLLLKLKLIMVPSLQWMMPGWVLQAISVQ